MPSRRCSESYAKRSDCGAVVSGSRKFLKPIPTSRYRCPGSRSTRSRSFKATSVNSVDEVRTEFGVWLRVRILNSLVFNFSTIVRAIRDSWREADQSFSARRRITGSVSAKRTSLSKVSSTEIDCVGRSGTTAFSSMPRQFMQAHAIAPEGPFEYGSIQSS